MSDSWRLTLPCSREQAEAVAEADVPGTALVATEEDEALGRWRLDAYFAGEPDEATIAAVRALIPGARGNAEPVAEQDWVTLSQAGLEPIREGRFVVHTAAFPTAAPPGGRAFLIEAGQAFGTGHHATTAGCLAMLDRLAGEVDRFDNIVDIGTGTGILAFAALELWPEAYVLATDLDPVAIQVTRANMAANDVEYVELLVADGVKSLEVNSGCEFDLIIANILAGPLIAMAGEIGEVAAPGAAIVLAGLIATQADEVIAAYRAVGAELERREDRGDWAILLLRAGEARGVGVTPAGNRDAWATDGR